MFNRPLLALFGLIVAGLAIRLVNLGAVEFWYDEAFTVLLSRLPWSRMIEATAGDTHPPLFYIIMWAWARLFGESEFAFRLPSVLASVAAVPMMWAIMGRWQVSDRSRLVVAGLLALGPFAVYFGQEARMYAVLQLVVLLGVLAVVDRRFWLLGLVNLALLYLHNYGMFYVAALTIYAWWVNIRSEPQAYPFRPAELHLFAAVIFPGLAWLPWAYQLAGQMAEVSTGYWIEPVTVGQLVYTLTIFIFGPFTRQWVLPAAAVSVAILAYALLQLDARRPTYERMQRLEWVWLALAPLAMAVVVSLLWQPVYLFRGLIGCVPFLYLLIFQPLADASDDYPAISMVFVLPCLLIGLIGYMLDVRDFKSTTLSALNRINHNWEEGDILYSTNDGNWVMFSLYQDRPVYLMPQCPGADHDRGALSLRTRQALGVPEVDLSAIDHERAWLLWNWGSPTSQCNVDRAAALARPLDPLWIIQDDDLNMSGIWLLEE